MSLQALLQQFVDSDAVQDCAAFCFGENTYILLYYAYQPHIDSPMAVDNYYPAYQQVRRSRLRLAAVLAAQYTLVDVAYTYKSLALLDSRLMVLRNSLLAHPQFGTYFVMEILCVAGQWAPPAYIPNALGARLARVLADLPQNAEAWIALTDLRRSPVCPRCGRCAQACPSGALTSTFDPMQCVRYWQAKGFQPGSAQARAMGNRLLGCHTCQEVCPYNAKARRVPPLVDGHSLFLAALQGKKGLLPYADSLGNNYLRPAKLLCLALNCAVNAADPTYLAYVDRLLSFPDERVVKATQAYIEALTQHR